MEPLLSSFREAC
jgi:hypothetical protein